MSKVWIVRASAWNGEANDEWTVGVFRKKRDAENLETKLREWNSKTQAELSRIDSELYQKREKKFGDRWYYPENNDEYGIMYQDWRQKRDQVENSYNPHDPSRRYTATFSIDYFIDEEEVK